MRVLLERKLFVANVHTTGLVRDCVHQVTASITNGCAQLGVTPKYQQVKITTRPLFIFLRREQGKTYSML